MYIFLVRHGQTDANVKHLFNGRNEKDLNATGISQAKSIAPIISNLPIDLIISSPLKRTLQTSRLLNSKNLEIITDDRIIERDFKKLTLKPTALVPEMSLLYNLGSYDELYGIEPFQSLYDRISDFLQDIKLKYNDKNILVVTHGDLIVAFQRFFDGKNPNVYPKNCEIIKYEI